MSNENLLTPISVEKVSETSKPAINKFKQFICFVFGIEVPKFYNFGYMISLPNNQKLNKGDYITVDGRDYVVKARITFNNSYVISTCYGMKNSSHHGVDFNKVERKKSVTGL